MTKEQKQTWIEKMNSQGWQLATHVTMLERRHVAWRHIGSLQFIKPKRLFYT